MQAARAARRKAKILEGASDRMAMFGEGAPPKEHNPEKSRLKLDDDDLDPALTKLASDPLPVSKVKSKPDEACVPQSSDGEIAVKDEGDLLDDALDDIFSSDDALGGGAVEDGASEEVAPTPKEPSEKEDAAKKLARKRPVRRKVPYADLEAVMAQPTPAFIDPDLPGDDEPPPTLPTSSNPATASETAERPQPAPSQERKGAKRPMESPPPPVTPPPSTTTGGKSKPAKKEGSAAAHTYDKGYKKWENFDVDQALEEVDTISSSTDTSSTELREQEAAAASSSPTKPPSRRVRPSKSSTPKASSTASAPVSKAAGAVASSSKASPSSSSTTITATSSSWLTTTAKAKQAAKRTLHVLTSRAFLVAMLPALFGLLVGLGLLVDTPSHACSSGSSGISGASSFDSDPSSSSDALLMRHLGAAGAVVSGGEMNRQNNNNNNDDGSSGYGSVGAANNPSGPMAAFLVALTHPPILVVLFLVRLGCTLTPFGALLFGNKQGVGVGGSSAGGAAVPPLPAGAAAAAASSAGGGGGVGDMIGGGMLGSMLTSFGGGGGSGGGGGGGVLGLLSQAMATWQLVRELQKDLCTCVFAALGVVALAPLMLNPETLAVFLGRAEEEGAAAVTPGVCA